MRVTAKWGWDRRDHSDRNTTEFYRFYRMLKFKWAQAVLREHILAELNELFSRLNMEVTLAIRGLISSQEIEAIRSRMLNGDVSFAEAYDACCV